MAKWKKRITRRQFINESLKTGAGVAIGFNLVGLSRGPTAFASETKEGLAPGMIGGPTGFEGAERYQYGPDEAPGRAILGLKKLREEGKAPKEIVLMLPPGCVGHWDTPFPKGAKPAKEVFYEETGIKIAPVDVVATEMSTTVVQDYQTGARAYDIYSFWCNDGPDLVQAGALLKLNDLVDQYKADWLDPKEGYVGGEAMFSATSKVFGDVYIVNMDGDEQVWVYRKDLFEDPKEQKAFKAKHGWDLQFPETWEQLDQVADFFHRPDKGLLGCTDIRNQYWGFTNWYQRYNSMGDPGRFFFDEDTAKPLVNSPEGIQATKEHVDTLRYHHKDVLSWGWPQQYANMAAGGAAVTCAYPNMPKFLDNPENKDSKIVGKIRSSISPGRVINGKLIRRTTWWPNVAHGVPSKSKYPEAVYLLLQWASSGKISTWLVANPGGYYDPWRVPHFKDPILIGSYHDWHVPVMVGSLERSCPPIMIPGVFEYQQILDTNLQEALTGRKTPEEAMADTEKEWEKVTERIGRDETKKAIKANRGAWPKDIYDEITIKV
jgi:multiple sugar transport system substrate-binding protein